ncbi:MAG: epoxide hydrolase [Rhodobiaceae bacterium]|nr:epoxide hydrolase [Rhodobiaceae bacterium]
MAAPTPFKVEINQPTIDAILAKVRAYDWHEMPEIETGADRWAYGADMDYMKELCSYWASSFDWRATEKKLNAHPQFKATVEDQEIHFYHVKGSGSAPQPIILTHGWPGSVYEFLDVIDRLAHPEKHGGKEEDGLTLIIPSLPGYGFSGKPKKPLGPKRTAELWDKLMRETLGYDTYIAQGGDWGSVVSGFLACNHGLNVGGGCKAVHLNMWGARPSGVGPQTPEEQTWGQAAAFNFEMEGAYLRLQMTKPQSLSYAMMDSPVGVAAWITEKFNSWTDTRGTDGAEHIENAYTKDQLLSNIMIYLVTRTFNTSTWFYRGMFEEGGTDMPSGTKVEVPTAIACFPKEFIPFPPRTMVEKGYNVTRWTKFEKGGHFAALETGPLFADDVAAFAAQVKG